MAGCEMLYTLSASEHMSIVNVVRRKQWPIRASFNEIIFCTVKLKALYFALYRCTVVFQEKRDDWAAIPWD